MSAPVKDVRFEPATAIPLSPVDFYRHEVLPRLTADQVYTDPSHDWSRSGGKLRGGCPWHTSKSGGSFNVTLNNLLWYCAGCGFGGDPVQYLWRQRGGAGAPRGRDFVGIIRDLSALAGVEFPERQLSRAEQAAADARAAKRAALETVYQRCQDELWSARGDAARIYLLERGIGDDAARDLELGLYPDLQEIRQALRSAGYKTSTNEGAWQDLHGFITFPWRDEYGHALTLYGRWSAQAPPADGRPKTLALPGEGSKASPLYFDRARRAHRTEIVMVEGLLDAAVAQAEGHVEVVAYVGGQPSFAQLETLKRNKITAATICPDPDAGGNTGIISFLRNVDSSIRAYVAPELPDSMDPDEFILGRGIEAWREHIAQAERGSTYRAREILKGHDLQSARGRDAALDELTAYASMVHPRDMDDVVALAADPLNTEPATLHVLLAGPGERRNGHAIDSTASTSRPSTVVAEDAQEILDDVIESGDCRVVFDAVPTLSRLPRAAYAKFKAELKDVLGSKINLNDLEGAVADVRRQNAKTAKAEVAEEAPTANEIANTILEDDHFAQDDGGKLWVYQHGVYIPRGAARIKSRVKAILEARDVSDEWTSHLASETAEYIRVDAPCLWERPPADILNLQNGLLDVRTSVLKPHSHHHLSAVQIPVAFDPDASCSAWETFVSETFPEDATDLAWELAAKLMTSDSAGQKATLFVGEGGNGKSTFLAGLNAFIGRSNVSSLSLHRLEADKFAAARLFGKLANICADLPSAHLSGTSTFKAITGGDAITGEYKYLESFDFVPFASLVFSANHPPQSTDGSQAFFDRWDVIPFNQSFRGTAREIPRTELDARLSAPGELSGLLNKALAVLPTVRKRGLSTPASCQAALAEFRAVTDPFAVWLDTATVEHPEAITPKPELLIAYNTGRKKEGGTVMTEQAFGRALRRHRPSLGDAQRMVGGRLAWVWVGIGLRGGDDPTSGDHNESGSVFRSRDSRDSRYLYRGGEYTPSPEGRREGVHSVAATDRENPVNPVNPVNGVAATTDDLFFDDGPPICATDGCPNIVTMPGLDCDDCLSRPTVPGAFR